MENINDIINEALDKIEAALDDLPYVSAEEIGLDRRAGKVWVDEDGNIIITSNPGSLDYYGGFEYVDEDAVTTLGCYKIYNGDYDGRVGNAIDFYLENKDEE